MDRSRKATREGNEVTLQHKSRKEALLVEELAEANLAQLQASIERLKQTPEGTAELQRRVKAFGECERIEGETFNHLTTNCVVGWTRKFLKQNRPFILRGKSSR